MRVSTILVAAAGAAASVVLAAGPAFAGEINGTGNPPGGEGLGSAHPRAVRCNRTSGSGSPPLAICPFFSNACGAPSVFMGAFVLFSVVFWCCGEGFGVSALR